MMNEKPKREIRDYLDAQVQMIHDLRSEGINANGIYIRESPVPINAVTREFVLSRLCSPSLTDSKGSIAGRVTEVKKPAPGADGNPTGSGDPPGTDDSPALLVDIEATHEGLTKNFTYYPSASLEQSTKTWTEPYLKPVITHHRNSDMFVPAEDPIGRVVAAQFKDSVLKPGTKTIQIRHRITDPEAQDKVVDGRYLTTSIGAIASSLHCSVCGVNVLESWCDHRRGQTYSFKKDENSPEEIKTAFWIVGPMWYEEDSYVNTPADEMAQVVNFEWETKAQPGKKRSESRQMETNVLNDMDQLLEGDEAPAVTDREKVAEPAVVAEAIKNDPAPVTEPTVEEKLAAVEKRAGELEEKLTLAEADAAAARTEAEEANVAKVKAEQELGVANAENKQLTEKAKVFATATRRALVDRVVDLKIAAGEAKEEDRVAVAEGLAGKKPSQLAEMAMAALTTMPARVVAQIASPGQIGADEVTEGTVVNKEPAELTLSDLADAMVNAMTMRNQ